MINKNSYGVDYSFVFKDLNRFFPSFNSSGVPIKEDGSHNISGVCGFGLANWNKYIESFDEECKKKFVNQIDFLKKNSSFIYPSNLKLNGLKSPWYSCLSQGLAASMFLRSYLLSALEVDKLNASHCLSNIFLKEYNLISEFNNKLFLEEYPYEKPNHVLNGFLSAYIAFLEYKNITDDSIFDQVIDNLHESLVLNIKYFNKNSWSLYEITDGKFYNYTTVHYHALHIAQLEYIRYLTNSNDFDNQIMIWRSSLFNLRLRLLAFLGKSFFRISNLLN